jgi:hypothetical protein
MIRDVSFLSDFILMSFYEKFKSNHFQLYLSKKRNFYYQGEKNINYKFFVFWDYDAGLPLESLQKLLQKRLIYFQRHLTPSTFCSRK